MLLNKAGFDGFSRVYLAALFLISLKSLIESQLNLTIYSQLIFFNLITFTLK